MSSFLAHLQAIAKRFQRDASEVPETFFSSKQRAFLANIPSLRKVRQTLPAVGLAGAIALGTISSVIAKPSNPGGEFSIDFAAAEPSSYNHKIGGGAFNDRTINTDVVESLQGGDFVCGDIVTYLMEITVDSGTQDVHSIDLDLQFLADTTGQSGVAHDDIVYVGVNYGAVQNGDGPGGTDAGMVDDGGSTATLISETFDGALFTHRATLNGTVRVTDLEANETVILRTDVHVTCDPGSSPTGNLQGAITDANVVTPSPDTINVGNQTIPFKIGGIVGIDTPLLDLAKTVTTDLSGADISGGDALTVDPGTTVRYLYTLTNANSRDIFDISITDDNGTPSDPSDDFTVNPSHLLSGALSDLDGEGDLGDLPVGATAIFYADVPLNTAGAVTNTATVEGDSGYSDGQNQVFTDSDTATVTVSTGSNVGGATLGSQVWEDTNFNGVQDAGEPGLDGVVVNLLAPNGTVEATQTTSGGGFYTFTDVTPGNYRLQFETPDAFVLSLEGNGKGRSNLNRVHGRSRLIKVDAGETVNTITVGYARDTDSDTIPDTVEGTGDRDGDGVPNYMDVDPAGYFYDEATGEIIAGGLISVSGPGAINITNDGSATGFYQWFIDGTPGTYTMTVTAPPGYEFSTTCLKQDPPPFDPTGGIDPTVIGNYEDGGNPGFLTSNNCTTFYLSFDLAAGDPFVINNNIPLKPISSTPICPAGQSLISSSGNADSQTNSSSFLVNNPNNALGSPDGNYAQIGSIGRLTLDLTDLAPEGSTIAITITRGNNSGEVRIDASTDDVNFSGETTYGDSADIPAGPVGTLETINYTVPTGGARYLRFRGASAFGQVRVDAAAYSQICVPTPIELDYGDAPAVYGTLNSDDGPRHEIVTGLQLGSLIDADSDGFGNGTDNNGSAADDSPGDDGVATFARLYDDSFDDFPVYGVNINVTNTTGSNANLVGWIDFDRNNQFDNNESVSIIVPDGTNAENMNLIFSVPNDIQAGTSYARFRLTTDAIDGDDPLGSANDGEVEDYVMTISSALPLPTNLNCGAPVSFPWEGDPGGYIWNVDDTSNSYSIPNLYDVDMTLSDPDNQNLDTGNPGVFSPPAYTETSGVFGGGLLTWSMTADNSDQLVTLTITFSEASVLNEMTIADIDSFSFATSYYNQRYGATYAQAARESFQDEVAITASFRGDNIPVSLVAAEAGLLTINGQSVKGSYPFNDPNSSLSVSDPRGQVQLSTTAPIDTLVITYSNGPEDQSTEQYYYGSSGISDDHSIAINLWTFCEAFPEIRGRVWDDDSNPNGIRDGGEANIGSVGVELYDAGDRGNPSATPIAVTTTAADGAYEFTNQRPGDYFIRFVPPLNKGFTTADQGGDDTIDSDADSSGDTADFTLTSGIDQENWDAGLITTTVASAPDLLLVKRITAINGDRTQNPNDSTPLNAVTLDDGATSDEHIRWPNGYLVGEVDAGLVKPGDEIEYTIYFLNGGDTNADDVRICDLIQANQSLVLDAYGAGTILDGTGADLELQLGASAAITLTTANDANDRTQLIAGGDTVPSDRDCNLKAANDNGVVVLDLTGAGGTGAPTLTTLPGSTGVGAPNDAYGLIRLTTRVDQ
ncbi:MAG: SdrD B-like domain-containing protein [Leptolyngbyaceae cyanobacterium MO_188.B28]|nr:SdrD B-like domain-containing protein [Leptolyngbyaceae cyanobacterium MO_188.B28]